MSKLHRRGRLILPLLAFMLCTSAAWAGPLDPPDSPLPQPYGKVIGNVLDPSGRPFPYIQVALVARPAGNIAYQAHADYEGSFAFLDVVPGIYLLRTFGPGDIEVCNDCVDFVLSPGQTVERTLVADPAARPTDKNMPAPARVAQHPPADSSVYVVIYSAGPNWTQGGSDAEMEAHVQFHRGLTAADQLLMAGPFTDATGGMAVLAGESIEAVGAIIAADPAVEAGVLDFVVHAWAVQYDRAGEVPAP